MDPSPKSLILDLLSTLRGGAMPVRALVRAGELFGLPENNVRVALARLLGAGLVERDLRGQYRLGASARAVQGRVASWRRLEERLASWRGHWAAVLVGPAARRDRAGRHRAQQALRLTGFRRLDPGLLIRPDNLVGGVSALRETLTGLGLGAGDAVIRLSDLDAGRETRARRLWDPDALPREHRKVREALEAAAERLSSLAPEAAMVESFRIGGRGLRTIILDPLLPDALVPGAERRALVEVMERYDEMGREAWRGFMEAHGVVRARTPLDTRLTDRPLAAAAGGAA